MPEAEVPSEAGEAGDGRSGAAQPHRSAAGLTAFIAVALALVLVAVSLIAGRVTAVAEPSPSTRSAEAGFARDMQTHHDQAVQMSMIVRDRSDDPEVRLLAYDIATSQSQQAGQMFGWLAVWGLPQASPDPPMTWMRLPVLSDAGGAAHSDHASAATDAGADAGAMPGMATREQLDELRRLSGRDAERLFLQLMIAHHQGGIEMAEGVVARSGNPVVTDLAGSMVTAQRAEVSLMEAMLADRPAE